MNKFLVLGVFCLALLFGLSSVSQSYASAKQAQAVIETARVAQIASVGNLVTLVTVAILVVAILATLVLVTWLFLRARTQQPRARGMPGQNAGWDEFPKAQANTLLPTLLTMLLVQMVQEQQQQTEQVWQMNDPANNVPALPDNTWDM